MKPHIARALRNSLLGAVAVSLLGATAVAAEKKNPAPARKPAEASEKAEAKKSPAPKAEEVEVYTNEDLERLFAGEKPRADGEAAGETAGEAPAATATPQPAEPETTAKPGEAAPSPEDPAAWLAARKAKAEERRKLIAEAQAKVDGLRARIADLEKRNLAARNPFLPRPEVPEEEREEWDKADGAQRVAATEQALDDARRELRIAEQELARARSAP